MASSVSSNDDDDHRDSDHNDERLAQLEALLAGQLYSAPPVSTQLRDAPSPPPPVAPSEPAVDEVVSFRLFSTDKEPLRVKIREVSPPAAQHRQDPRIRSVEDEDPQIVHVRAQRIASVAVTGQQILDESATLPCPHPPSYRLTSRVLSRRLQTPSTSTRERLGMPHLAYLDAVLPKPLALCSPRTDPPPKEPNEGLIVKGPFKLGSKRDRLPKRSLVQDPTYSTFKLEIKPILGQEKDVVSGWNKLEKLRVRKERDKERKKVFKAKLNAIKFGDADKPLSEAARNGRQEKRRRTGRLSKERRERAKKRIAAKVDDSEPIAT
ncbi:uncharacterized protein JCM15063_000726 [Sporobolomyces koalae]|uniref:uncharacterized protein n=1 Tax=Sporobolomyces koalae TaxID=500713 RepID=UPI00316C51A7